MDRNLKGLRAERLSAEAQVVEARRNLPGNINRASNFLEKLRTAGEWLPADEIPEDGMSITVFGMTTNKQKTRVGKRFQSLKDTKRLLIRLRLLLRIYQSWLRWVPLLLLRIQTDWDRLLLLNWLARREHMGWGRRLRIWVHDRAWGWVGDGY